MATTPPLNVSLLITANASGASAAVAETKREVQSVGETARATGGALNQLGTANDNAAAASRRASEAARGQAAAERDLRAAVASFAGIRPEASGAEYAGRRADIEAYGAALDQLRAKYNPVFAASKAYERELNDLNRALSLGAVTAREHGAALEALNARYTAAGTASAVYANQAGMARMQTANLAFQFQDIGTMMASGQNPFILLAQQLPQVTMYGGQLGGVMGALKATLAGFVSPLGLLTTGFVLAGSAAISYFADAGDEAAAADNALREHQDQITRVAKEWGDSIPALKAYADELERSRSAAERDAAIKERQTDLYQDFKNNLPDLASGIGDVVLTLNQLGDESGAADTLSDAFERLDKRVSEGKASISDYRAVQDALAAILENYATPAVQDLADELDELAKSYNKAAYAALGLEVERQKLLRPANRRAEDDSLAAYDAMRKANQDYIAAQERRNALTGDQLKLENEIARVRSEVERAGGFLGEDQLRDIATANLAADARQSPRRRRSSPAEREAERYADIIRNAEQAIAMQRLEADSYGMTEIAADRLRQQEELLNQARSAGIDLTPEQIARLKELGTTLADVTAETERQGEALAMQRGLWGDAIGGLRQAAADGKIELQELGDIGIRMFDRLIDKMQTDLIDALGALGGGGFGSILSAIFGGGGGFKPNTTFGAFLGLDDGGYTGSGGRLQPAGYVHRDEFVFSSPAVRTIGVSKLDRMHKAAKSGRGFDDGGWTGDGAPAGSSSAGAGSRAGMMRFEQNIYISGAVTPREIMEAIERGTDAAVARAREEFPVNYNQNKQYGLID